MRTAVENEGSVVLQIQAPEAANGELGANAASASPAGHADPQCGRVDGCLLTGRQLRLVELLVAGLPDKLIADEMCLREDTVGSYLKVIFRKAGVHSRTGLAVWWLKNAR